MVNAEYHVLGLMSGTSLDGLDLAHCTFLLSTGGWKYSINAAETVEYPPDISDRLKSSMQLSALDMARLNVDLGLYYGRQAGKFLQKIAMPTQFIASHGHTIFHQPAHKLTLQIGSPAHIAAESTLPVVADFRSTDVALGGNGAPLVPVGDAMLFKEYDVCLNLGGIANFSYEKNGKRFAWDICPFNMIFNFLSGRIGAPYDHGGKYTASGTVNQKLLQQLESLSFYADPGPKSLGKEWVDSEVIPLFSTDIPIADQMNTFCHHVAGQIARSFPGNAKKILLTGGGAFHQYFVELLREKCPEMEIKVPDEQTVQFKEALIFAFLGVLRWRGEVNCLASVTGAAKDSVAGVVYY